MKRNFLQLEPRQQLLVAGSAALVATVLAASLLLQLHQTQHKSELQLAQTAEELVQVKTMAAQLAALHASSITVTGEAVDLTAVVSASLQLFGLQPTRMQQGSAEELQLRLDAVPYADAIAWLAALEQHGAVVLLRATFTQGSGGTTNLTVSLKKRP